MKRRKPQNYRHRVSPQVRAILKLKLLKKMGGKCIDCGYNTHPVALDFDHLDPSKKCSDVSTLLGYGIFEECLEEAKKCVIRCANCHRIKTYYKHGN